jgi:hypothetical protein
MAVSVRRFDGLGHEAMFRWEVKGGEYLSRVDVYRHQAALVDSRRAEVSFGRTWFSSKLLPSHSALGRARRRGRTEPA